MAKGRRRPVARAGGRPAFTGVILGLTRHLARLNAAWRSGRAVGRARPGLVRGADGPGHARIGKDRMARRRGPAHGFRMSGRRPAPADRVAGLDWPALEAALEARGHAVAGPLLSPSECRALAALYAAESGFRSRVVMARYGFGQGEYRYFSYPLPPLVAGLRAALYARLVPIARRWNAAMGRAGDLPATLDLYLERCHAAGQTRPTPLLLRYRAGDYNCLHQDLYGEHAFPLQATILLSAPGADFEGGEFVLVEQRPRMQSRADVVPLGQGEAVIFAVNDRPVQGKRGPYRVKLRHGVSRLRGGERFTLGVIFHDAR